MKVFISWSGERSQMIAEALRYWLPSVIQAIQPWASSDDIEKGTRWRTGLAEELEQARVGIICLTPENLDSPWLHFEAGALYRQQNTRVCTYLYDLDLIDVREPLAQFQATKVQKDDTLDLMRTINGIIKELGENALPETQLDESFNTWWPKLEQSLRRVPRAAGGVSPQRDVREILEEILGLVRSQARESEYMSLPLSQEVPRLRTTLAWPPEDARILFQYYQQTLQRLEALKSSSPENDDQQAALEEYTQKLANDEEFARQELGKLRSDSQRAYTPRRSLTLGQPRPQKEVSDENLNS